MIPRSEVEITLSRYIVMGLGTTTLMLREHLPMLVGYQRSFYFPRVRRGASMSVTDRSRESLSPEITLETSLLSGVYKVLRDCQKFSSNSITNKCIEKTDKFYTMNCDT